MSKAPRMLLEANDVAIRPRPPFLKYAVPAGLSVAIVAGGLIAANVLRADTMVVSRDDVVIATARRASFAPSLRVTGEVAARDPTVLAARDGGRVATLVKRNGDVVEAGEVILTLENTAVAREVAAERARLTAQLGDLVAVEAQISAQLQAREDALRDARYRLATSERDLARQEVLAERGFASAVVLDRLRADQEYAREVVASSEAALAGARRDGLERTRRLASVRVSVESLLRAQNDRLASLEVRAPASGRLTGITVAVGAPVSESQILGRIENESQLEILAVAPESRQSDLRLGEEAVGQANGKSVRLTILEIDPTVTAGEVRLRLGFVDEPPAGLRLGQSVDLQIAIGTRRDAIVLPAGAAVGPARAFIVEGSTARSRPVEVGGRSGSNVEILRGVSPGDQVVVSAPPGFEDADHLRFEGR